jgi:hypothetical protein
MHVCVVDLWCESGVHGCLRHPYVLCMYNPLKKNLICKVVHLDIQTYTGSCSCGLETQTSRRPLMRGRLVGD